MHFFKFALSLALLAGSALSQSTLLTFTESTLTAGHSITVQVGIVGSENINVVAIVIGLSHCYDDQCYPPSSIMGKILYQGPYTPKHKHLYADYTVAVPASFPLGQASLNVISFFMVGASSKPIVDYLNANVTVVA